MERVEVTHLRARCASIRERCVQTRWLRLFGARIMRGAVFLPQLPRDGGFVDLFGAGGKAISVQSFLMDFAGGDGFARTRSALRSSFSGSKRPNGVAQGGLQAQNKTLRRARTLDERPATISSPSRGKGSVSSGAAPRL